MSLELPFGIEPKNPSSNIDERYGEHSTLQEALTATQNTREIGLTVLVNGDEYWFREGIADNDLVLKTLDISVKTDKGGYEGTAQDLKDLIDVINQLLTSDDTNLDELQEIVDYIKQNKDDLENLSIPNIAGLQNALDLLQSNIDAEETRAITREDDLEGLINDNINDVVIHESLEYTLGLITLATDENKSIDLSEWFNPINTALSESITQEEADDLYSFTVDDTFYLDDDKVLRPNITTYKQSIYFESGSQVFILDFEPTYIISIFVNGVYLDDDDYIYTATTYTNINPTIEILGELEQGDKIRISYEHFVNNPYPYLPD